MGRVDIRVVKTALRNEFKQFRIAMPSETKLEKDRLIREKLTRLRAYIEAKTLLCFMSTPIEVDTHDIIQAAWADGKTVAVPRCINGAIDMRFYVIHSFDQLEPATFSVLEPIVDRCTELTDFSRSICVVPGLGFDMQGYRLGYGKGYYDRFLANYVGKTVGICYNGCMKNLLPHGRYDRAVDTLVTEKFIKHFTGTKRK